MEQAEDKSATNEPASCFELKMKDYVIGKKPQDCILVEASAFSLPIGTGWPERHSSTHFTLDGDSGNRCAMSLLGSQRPCTSPFSINHTEVRVGELTVKGFKASTPQLATNTKGIVGRHRKQGLWQHLYQFSGSSRSTKPSGHVVRRDEDPILFNNGEHSGKIPFNFQDSAPLLGKQGIDNPAKTSALCIDNYGNNKILPSSTPCPKVNRSKILCSSSFSRFFVRHTLKGKEILSEGPEGHGCFGVAPMIQYKDKLVTVGNIASNALSKAGIDQLSQQIVGNRGLKPLQDGISLRDWLKPGYHKINKAERLHLFWQIVQLVDSVHAQGVALQDLRPSCFILLRLNGVRYTGSSIQKEPLKVLTKENSKKRPMELKMHMNGESGLKQRKVSKDIKLVDTQHKFTSRAGINDECVDEIDNPASASQDFCFIENVAGNNTPYQFKPIERQEQSIPATVHLEKKWYACPDELSEHCHLASNVYNLGVLLFELLCCFESSEKHCAAMLDLHHRILPPHFLSENPKEAAFCLVLLHPKPSSRLTTREILQSELLCVSDNNTYAQDNLPILSEEEDDVELEVLLYFLSALKELKQTHSSRILENIETLDADIKEVERRLILGTTADRTHKSSSDAIKQPHVQTQNEVALSSSISMSNVLEPRLMTNIDQFGSAYFNMRSHIQLKENIVGEQMDKDLLRSRDQMCQVQSKNEELCMKGKPVDHLGAFFEGICKFSRFTKFEPCGTLRTGDLLNSANMICSLSVDREEDYIAAAGVSKKIKIFEFGSLLNDSVDIHYPVVEMSNKSKLSCVCWNSYIRNYLVSTDYDGVVQLWDANSGQGFSQFIEHQKRAWSVDFSQVDPTKFASGSDDFSVKLWSINERNSTNTIWNPANVCCIQFSAFSSHLLAFGSADYKIYCYDIRHSRIPWCTLSGHGKAVSYVKFLDSETLVSASTDNTLKLWDLSKTNLEGLSSNSCMLTFTGHTNEKNFVGLSVFDGYIACGSETNEVYAYNRYLPMPIASQKFGSVDPISGHENDDSAGQFVSSVCWRQKSNMVVAANSSGSIKLFQMI